MHKNWKYALNAAAVILAIIAFVVAAMTSVKLGILMLIGSIFTGCIANDIFNPTVTKWLSIALWALMIPFLFVGSATSGTQIKWQMETSNAALPRPKKTESEWKELIASLKGIARSMDKNADGQDKLREELVEGQKNLTEEVRRSTAIAEEARDAAKAAKDKLGTIAAPAPNAPPDRTFVPPEEVPGSPHDMKVPRTYVPPLPAEPAPEALPKPNGEILPNLIPKDPLPDLWARTEKKSAPHYVRALKCTCGKVHEIERYDLMPSGISIPQYKKCPHGCEPVEYGRMIVK